MLLFLHGKSKIDGMKYMNHSTTLMISSLFERIIKHVGDDGLLNSTQCRKRTVCRLEIEESQVVKISYFIE